MFSSRRPALSLDGIWEFVPDPGRELLDPRVLPAGKPIGVPGAWEAQLREPYGVVRAWYRRSFTEPEDWRDGCVVLHVGAVMARAEIWLDGRLIGEHGDGYLPFEIEVGPPRPGAHHEIAIAVENPLNILSDYPAFEPDVLKAANDRLRGRSFETMPHGKQTWYTSTSGLLGPVSAEVAPELRLAALTVLPDLDARRVFVRWRTAGPGPIAQATLHLTVTAPGGDVVARTTAEASAGTTQLAIPSPEVWDLWTPALYRLDARLRRDHAREEPADEASVRFGMRSIAVRDGAILLNGRPIYVRGALDQDFWPGGRSNPPSRTALETQVGLAREMGLNLLRCHIKIPDPAYLDVADEAGLLLWCELPSWSRFDVGVARTAERMLARMVETMGSHPSIVAWTVINEEWGVDLRHSARDRRWLRRTADWLKTLDPSRLVVDNSACEPTFHLRTDLADFHAYRSMPDGAARWRALVTDFARRPSWLWSPHGDASVSGDEALVMSEFGGWGLPRPSHVVASDGSPPWWWTTGLTFRRPAGVEHRFEEQRLDRVWPNVDALADATQWQQLEGLAAQVRELRRHSSIRGYVITEFADAFWEANGLLDAGRGRKVFHDRLAELNAPRVLIVDLPRADLWGGERVVCDVTLSSFPDSAEDQYDGGGRLEWTLRLGGSVSRSGPVALRWVRFGAAVVARLELDVPDIEHELSGELLVTAKANSGNAMAVYRQTVVVVPSTRRRSAAPHRIRVVDPLDLWSIASRLANLGHDVHTPDPDLVVTSHLDAELVAEIDRGARLVLLARSPDAIPTALELARPISVRSRGTLQPDLPWDGDYSSVFAWSLPGIVPGLRTGGLLGVAHAEIFPDHVLEGPPARAEAGLFSGWVHSPAALLTTFAQNEGRVAATTLRVAPEDGPVATALLESLIQRALGERAPRGPTSTPRGSHLATKRTVSRSTMTS